MAAISKSKKSSSSNSKAARAASKPKPSSSSRQKAASSVKRKVKTESSIAKTVSAKKETQGNLKAKTGSPKTNTANKKTISEKSKVTKAKATSTKNKTSGTVSSNSSAKTGTKTSAEKNSKSRAELIRKAALAYPETSEDFPWGHSAFKVKNKTFCWMSFAETGMRLTVKLTDSRFYALSMPGVDESNYGLGKHGWVTALFSYDKDFPLEMLKRWLDESFRAVAPKAITKLLPPVDAKRRS